MKHRRNRCGACAVLTCARTSMWLPNRHRGCSIAIMIESSFGNAAPDVQLAPRPLLLEPPGWRGPRLRLDPPTCGILAVKPSGTLFGDEALAYAVDNEFRHRLRWRPGLSQ